MEKMHALCILGNCVASLFTKDNLFDEILNTNLSFDQFLFFGLIKPLNFKDF